MSAVSGYTGNLSIKPGDLVAELFEGKTDEELRDEDEAKTGQVRCIGCGKFVARSSRWNQCPECDTREPWEMR